MSKGKHRLALPSLFVALTILSGCGGGGVGETAELGVLSVTQDLDADPDGHTTVIDFGAPAPVATLASFQADNGAQPVELQSAGDSLTVRWDARVTPSDQVRIVGVAGVDDDFMSVVTTDDSAPTFVVDSATQGAGLGNDSFTVTFSGPRVVPEVAGDGGNWEVVVDGVAFGLDASALSFDPSSQTLSVTTDSSVNLHASFELRAQSLVSVADVPVAGDAVAGTATGDLVAPTLVSTEQVLGADEFGRAVELTFDEALDPHFSIKLVNFSTGVLIFPSSVEQVAPERVRLTFLDPVVPGIDNIAVAGVVDAHGNAFPSSSHPVVAGSTVVNAYAGSPELRSVPGVGGDQLVIVTSQALDPESAEDPANWTLSIDGSPVDISGQFLSYELLAKTLTVPVPVDSVNGTGFDLTPVAPIDVDGEPFAATFSGFVGGDEAAPMVASVIQNRDADESGVLVDVTFDEDVELASAETAGNYGFSGGISVLAAKRLGDESVVRLTLDQTVVPGEFTVAVNGVLDPAGNAMAPVVGLAVASTDLDAPAITGAVGQGVEGLDNDLLTLQFDDLLIESEVTDPLNWIVESPIGTSLDTSGASVVWNGPSRTATLTFDAGNDIDFQVGDDFRVSLVGVRDLGGNPILALAATGTPTVESDYPEVEAVFVKDAPADNVVVVVFDEPIAVPDSFVDALHLDEFGGVFGLPAATARVAGHPRVLELTFPDVVVAGAHQLNLTGVLDAAGNPFFGIQFETVAAQDFSEPTLDAGAVALSAVSGESNDLISVVFDVSPSTWGLFDLANYSLSLGGVPQQLSGSSFSFDGDRTVTIELSGGLALQRGSTYTLEVDGLESAQGVALAFADSAVVIAGGDALAPDVAADRVRLDPSDPASSLIVEFDEAMDAVDLEAPASYAIGATAPTSVTRLGARTARLTFAGGVLVGDTLDVTAADLAGNVGAVSRLVTAADVGAPTILSATAESVPGFGGDRLHVVFDEPLTQSSATSASNFGLRINGSLVDIDGAVATYDSNSNTVTLQLPAGVDFDGAGTAEATAEGLIDLSGNAMPAPDSSSAALAGDADGPVFVAAFLERRESITGSVVVARFDEDVDPILVINPANYLVTGGQTVTAVESLGPDTFRLRLSGAMLPNHTVTAFGLENAAGIASVATSIDPVD